MYDLSTPVCLMQLSHNNKGELMKYNVKIEVKFTASVTGIYM